MFEKIYEALIDKDYGMKEDYDEVEIDSPNLRRVAQILVQKTKYREVNRPKDGLPVMEFSSVLQRSFDEVQVRDSLLSIASLCADFSIF